VPQATTLLDHVRDLRVRFYVAGGGWVDAWPPPNSTPTTLPAAVEITVTLDGRGQLLRILRVGP